MKKSRDIRAFGVLFSILLVPVFCMGFVPIEQKGYGSLTIEQYAGNEKAPYAIGDIVTMATFSTNESDYYPYGVQVSIAFPIDEGSTSANLILDLALRDNYTSYSFDSTYIAWLYIEQAGVDTSFYADMILGEVHILDAFFCGYSSAIEIGFEIYLYDYGPDGAPDTEDDQIRHIPNGYAVTNPAPEVLRASQPDVESETWYIVEEDTSVNVGLGIGFGIVAGDSGDGYVEPGYDSGSCDGDVGGDGSSGGCDGDTGGSGGCDGDTGGSGGCDGDTGGSGCSGDGLDSGGGCGGGGAPSDCSSNGASGEKRLNKPKYHIGGPLASGLLFLVCLGFILRLRYRR